MRLNCNEEEARMKIYSVSTRCYYAFGALVSEEVSLKIKELFGVRWVLPDSYLDVKNKDYGGEHCINGQVVPYDPKYHEEWIRNNSRANERNRRNDRPRNFDRSRNLERRRENMQNCDFQNTGPSPMPKQVGPNSGPGPANMGTPPPNRGPMSPNVGPPPPNRAPMSLNMGHPPPNRGPMPHPNMGPPNNYNDPQPSNNWNSGPPNSYNQAPLNSYNQMPPNNYNLMPLSLPLTQEGCHQTTWLRLLMQDRMILDNTRITTHQTGILESILVQTVTKLEASYSMMSLVGML